MYPYLIEYYGIGLKYSIVNPKNKACSSVDRASDSGPGGRGFNSRHAYCRLFLIGYKSMYSMLE